MASRLFDYSHTIYTYNCFLLVSAQPTLILSFGRTRRRRRRRRRPTRRSPTPTSRFQRRRHTRRARHAGRRPIRRRRRRRRTHGQVSRDDQWKRHPEPSEETTPHHHRFAVHRAVEPLRHPVRVRVRVRFVRCAPRRRGLRTLALPTTGVRSIVRSNSLNPNLHILHVINLYIYIVSQILLHWCFPKMRKKTESRRVLERLLCAHRLLLDPEAKAGTFASSATNSPHKQEEIKKDEIRCRLPLGTSSFSSSASSFVRIVALRPWGLPPGGWMDGWDG